MTFGTSRGRLYDAQKTARTKYDSVQDVWADQARAKFHEAVWEPLDRLVTDVLRAVDQVAVVFTQVRTDCEYTPDH